MRGWHFTGSDGGLQWPGSRVILGPEGEYGKLVQPGGVLCSSTANLYSAVQPGGTLFGLQFSNPVNTDVAYEGDSKDYGQSNDPMVGGKIGGVNVFGGGLALYNAQKQIIGAVGVSGDSSCADHNIAWRTRNNLKLDFVPGGVSGDPSRPDKYRVRHYNSAGLCHWGEPRADGAIRRAARQRRRLRLLCLLCSKDACERNEGLHGRRCGDL